MKESSHEKSDSETEILVVTRMTKVGMLGMLGGDSVEYYQGVILC